MTNASRYIRTARLTSGSSHPTKRAELPEWAIEALRAKTSRQASAEDLGEEIPNGSRNERLTSHGGALRRQGLGELAIRAALRGINETACDPPLEDWEVRKIARSVARYEPGASFSFSFAPNSNGKGKSSEKARPRLRSRTFGEMGEPEPRRYVVEDLVPEAYPAMIYGDGGVAKSLSALSLGLAVSRGAGTWLGRKVEAGGVLYLDFELDAPEQLRRVSQLASAEGLEHVPVALRYMSAVGVSAKDAFADALAECKEHGTKLLIVDSLGPALEGDTLRVRGASGLRWWKKPHPLLVPGDAKGV